jgi:hypothetical protein
VDSPYVWGVIVYGEVHVLIGLFEFVVEVAGGGWPSANRLLASESARLLPIE